ncbi:MAG TPA: CBS domain-containing protein [Solirubrobacterales bacterium]|jgi:CBS domain-containing protein|nr:CBS domain-containing protein [Solirubrobacterales bacterium]
MKTAAEIMNRDVPSVVPEDARAAIDLLAQTDVGAVAVVELMTADPVVSHDHEAADRVAKKIADKHHNHLPVVEVEGRLAGMVTHADALAALVDDE